MADSARGLGKGEEGGVPPVKEALRSWGPRETVEPADFDSLVRLVQGCFGEGWSRAALESALSAGSGRLWMLQDPAGKGLGFLLARRILDGVEVDLLGVDPGRRRSGRAGRLLDALIDAEGGTGAKRIQLEIRRSNTAARSLYESRGFVVAGERSRYYPNGEDALLWTLELG
jgi:ribosomal-protein-alanine N-acetyltransferase